MKILQINKFFFLKGGSERYFFDLSDLLSEKKHQVVVWSTQHPKNFSFSGLKDFAQFNDFSKYEGLLRDFKKVRRIFWNKEAAKKLEKVIKREKPDIAHLHNIFSHLSPSIIFTLKKYNIPIIMTLHDYKLFCPNYQLFSQGKICFDCLEKRNFSSCLYKKCIKDSYTKSLIGYLEAKLQKDILKTAGKIDIFLAPSRFMKKKAIEAGIPAKKIIHLPYFVNINEKHNNSFLKEKNPYLLYFGRLSQEKGVKLLIKSFLNLSDKFPKWKLKIAGNGPEKDELKRLAENNKNIEFLGRKQRSQLKKIISKSYLTILPSIWPDNFPFSILESLVLTKPVLAAKIGGIPELIKDRKTGLVFKPNNQKDLTEKIIWAINNKKEMKKISNNIQKGILDKYSKEKHYNKLIKIYERIQNN